MTSNSPTTKMLAAGFTVFAVIVLFFSLPFYLRQRNVIKNWIHTEAQVSGIRTTSVRLRSGQMRFNVEYQLTFFANGQPVVVPVQTSTRSTDIQQGLSRFPSDKRVPIAYNPAAPNEIQVEPGYTGRFFAVPLFISGIGVILATIAAVLWMISRRLSASGSDEKVIATRHPA